MATRAEIITANFSFLDSELARANKAGRLEAQTVHAVRATAAGVRALALIQLDTNDLLRELIAKS